MIKPTHVEVMARRPNWCGTIDDWEWLAYICEIRANVIPLWRGLGTVLLVVSTRSEGPLSSEALAEFRELVAEWAPVNAKITVTSVG